MSYEGRVIFICPKGHITQIDAYEDYDYDSLSADYDPRVTVRKEPRKKRKCFCGEDIERVGGVDDTNGESVSRFYKKQTTEGSRDIKYLSETDTSIITIKHPTYQIIYGKDGELFNFDTGKKLKF